MAHVVLTLRLLVGAALIFYGLDDIMNFMEPDYGRKADRFLSAMASTGYMNQVRGSIEILCGLLLLVSRWVPLALILFAPIMMNILLFHAFLEPTKITVAAVIGVVMVFFAYCYWPYFRALFVMNTPSRYGAVLRRGGGGAPKRPAAAAPAGGGGPPRPPAPSPGGGPPKRPTPPGGGPPRTP